ncbi:MAG: peptidoglycan-binding domain-containing protein [Bradyrhizobium sp.]
MPRKIADDDEMPRRRRGAKAVAIEANEERGLAMRMLLHSPKDTVAGTLAAAAVVAIIINALLLQAGRHPSPMFGSSVVTLPPPAPVAAASPLPRPRPVEAAVRPAESTPPPPESKPVEAKSGDKSADKGADPMTNLVVKSTSAPSAAPSNVARPPAPIPASNQPAGARRVAAVQRALTEYGYGQLKPTGTIGSDTQAAISKFERERKLPVTGQMSDRLVRELTAVIGHPID